MRRKIGVMTLLAFSCAIAPAVGARAALLLSLDSFDLPVGGPTPITVPVRLKVTDAPIELGSFNVAVVFSPDDPGTISTELQVPAASPGTIFGGSNFSVAPTNPFIDVGFSDNAGDGPDVTLGVGTHLLGELNLTVEAAASGTLVLGMSPSFTQFSNTGGVITEVTFEPGMIHFGRVVIPEPQSGLLAALGVLACWLGATRRHGLRPTDGHFR